MHNTELQETSKTKERPHNFNPQSTVEMQSLQLCVVFNHANLINLSEKQTLTIVNRSCDLIPVTYVRGQSQWPLLAVHAKCGLGGSATPPIQWEFSSLSFYISVRITFVCRVSCVVCIVCVSILLNLLLWLCDDQAWIRAELLNKAFKILMII